MPDDLFDDLPDITPKGTIRHTLSHVFVHSDKPLALVMQYAGVSGNPGYASELPKYESQRALLDARGDREGGKALYRGFLADHVVVGWENCNDKERKPLPYAPDLARRLFASIIARGGEDQLAGAFFRAGMSENFRDSPEAIAAALGKA